MFVVVSAFRVGEIYQHLIVTISSFLVLKDCTSIVYPALLVHTSTPPASLFIPPSINICLMVELYQPLWFDNGYDWIILFISNGDKNSNKNLKYQGPEIKPDIRPNIWICRISVSGRSKGRMTGPSLDKCRIPKKSCPFVSSEYAMQMNKTY